MKRLQYILLSSLLSLLIIYMGVGIPFVQYRCMNCAGTDSVKPLLMVAEVSGGGCTCGCSDASGVSRQTADAGCCCGSGTGGCCSRKLASDTCCDIPANPCGLAEDGEAEARTGADGCQTVRIEKICLPTLTDGLHLDDVEMPAIDYLFCNLIVPEISNSLAGEGRHSDSAPPYRICPRAYINLICTLLI